MPTEKFSEMELVSGLRALLGYCAQLGLDVERMVKAAALPDPLAGDPRAALPQSARLALWREAIAASGDPHLHLHVVEHAPFGDYFSDLICAASPTVGEALRVQCQLLKHFDIPMSLSLHRSQDRGYVRVRSRGEAIASRRQVEYVLALCYLRARRAMGMDFTPLLVEFALPAPADRSEVERLFACPVRDGAAENRLWLRTVDLQRENSRHDPAVLSVLKAAVPAASSAEALHPILQQIEHLLQSGMGKGGLSVRRTARSLGMSQRTLQRRLAESGTNFSQVLNRLRKQMACRLIQQGHSLVEISEQLGYSELSAFSRAFKRWTGTPPSVFRV